jgi:hypothetical protein
VHRAQRDSVTAPRPPPAVVVSRPPRHLSSVHRAQRDSVTAPYPPPAVVVSRPPRHLSSVHRAQRDSVTAPYPPPAVVVSRPPRHLSSVHRAQRNSVTAPHPPPAVVVSRQPRHPNQTLMGHSRLTRSVQDRTLTNEEEVEPLGRAVRGFVRDVKALRRGSGARRTPAPCASASCRLSAISRCKITARSEACMRAPDLV